MEIVEWKFIYIDYTLNQGTAVKKATVGPRQELDLRFRCSTLTNRRTEASCRALLWVRVMAVP
jgi:hypothetical protein